MNEIRTMDVCAGAGGWAVAARGLPIRIVAAFDREEDCLATYAENHPGVECIRCDVSRHDFSDWTGKIDLVLGGIPCEQISQLRRVTPPSAETLDQFRTFVARCLDLAEHRPECDVNPDVSLERARLAAVKPEGYDEWHTALGVGDE